MQRRTAALMAWSEIHAALERGVINAGEWVGPYDVMKRGLHRPLPMSGARQGWPLDHLVSPVDRDAASLYAFNTALIRVCQPGPCARNHPSTSGSTRREMDSLAAAGLSPRLTMARTMCAGSASGWPRSILTSRSCWAATLGQSVRDALEVDFALTPRRLSHGVHLLRIGEVESVLLDVPSSLRLMPRDHRWSVYTSCIRVKGMAARGLQRDRSGNPRGLGHPQRAGVAGGAGHRLSA